MTAIESVPPLPMSLRLIASVTVLVDEPIDAGVVRGGIRWIVPIVGGRAEGPDIYGNVLPLGADWNLIGADGRMNPDARYLIRTDDDVVLSIRNTGSIPVTGGITVPEIEAPADGPYAWLNGAVLVGSLTPKVVDEVLRGVIVHFAQVVDPAADRSRPR